MKNKERIVSLLVLRSLSHPFRREQSWNFLHHARVNPGEFNTRLNVRERYADLRRQFITHFKADDAENARGGRIESRQRIRSSTVSGIARDQIIALDPVISIYNQRHSIDFRKKSHLRWLVYERRKEKGARRKTERRIHRRKRMNERTLSQWIDRFEIL